MSNVGVSDLPWLQALDNAMTDVADAYLAFTDRVARVAEAVSHITISMAMDAGYPTPEALVTERYEGMFKGLEPKVVQPALRASGFSQSQTALMCGVTTKNVKSREAYARQKSAGPNSDQQSNEPVTAEADSEPEVRSADPQPKAKIGDAVNALTLLASCTERQLTAAMVEVFGGNRSALKTFVNALHTSANKIGV